MESEFENWKKLELESESEAKEFQFRISKIQTQTNVLNDSFHFNWNDAISLLTLEQRTMIYQNEVEWCFDSYDIAIRPPRPKISKFPSR